MTENLEFSLQRKSIMPELKVCGGSARHAWLLMTHSIYTAAINTIPSIAAVNNTRVAAAADAAAADDNN